jgi:hypothetical protein
MMDTVLVACFGLHLLGDFYLQTDKMAERKRHSVPTVLLHCLLYAVAFLPLLFFGWNALFLTIVLAHLCIDILKSVPSRTGGRQGLVFAVDQVLHLAVLAIAVKGFGVSSTLFAVDVDKAVRVAVYLLAVGKPVSVAFVSFFGSRRPELLPEGTAGGGRIIGYLERLLLACLLLGGQGQAIGWVIAAKAFARSGQIASSPSFCEYFLIGTLFSLLSVILFYGALFG